MQFNISTSYRVTCSVPFDNGLKELNTYGKLYCEKNVITIVVVFRNAYSQNGLGKIYVNDDCLQPCHYHYVVFIYLVPS
jgi:hypothetical protein